MAYFDDALRAGSLGGVELPSIASRRHSGGRAFASRRYPYRDGQQVEDTGREPRIFELDVPLFRSVDPSDFPERYDALLALVEDEGAKGEVEYVDPYFGPVPVKIVSIEDTFSGERRDGARLSIRLEEIIDEPATDALRGQADPRREAELAASELDAALDEAGVGRSEIIDAWEADGIDAEGALAGVPAGTEYSSTTGSYFDRLEQASLAADDLAAQVDAVRAKVDAVRRLEAYGDPESYSIVRSATRLLDSCTLGAEAVAAQRPRLVVYEVPATLSHVELAALLYGDPDRAQEIVDLNPTTNPLAYPAGASLTVLAE